VSIYRTVDDLPGMALNEWRSGILPGASMTLRDLRLAARLRERSSDTRIDVKATDGGIEVTATGAVGIIRFDAFEVRVDPKLPGDHLHLFRMVEFAEGLDGLVELAGSPRVRGADANLLDLIVDMLSAAAERILTVGLRADYVEHEGDLPALRGRLLSDRQHLERFGLYDRVCCRFDEHEHDIADNQLLAHGLAAGARIATTPRVRRRARGLAAVLADFCDPAALDPELGPDAFVYGRHNEHYRAAHVLSWMVLERRGPDEALMSGPARLRSFLLDMNTLFERFLERVLRLALASAGVRVDPQQSGSIFWRPAIHKHYARVRPDLLITRVERAHARLTVDAKYKRYDGQKADVGDLTQVFLYAYAYRDPEAIATPPRAILVHPSETAGVTGVTPLQVRSVAERSVDAELAVVGVHIPTVLDDVAAGGGKSLDALADTVLRWTPPTGLEPDRLPASLTVSAAGRPAGPRGVVDGGERAASG
jgi:5-methylcytosine-specific restriction enzyme subunit McrC